MEVVVAKSAGFCYGVKRAMDAVLKAARSHGGKMFTIGPLIHNPQVIRRLEDAGVFSVADLGEIPADAVAVLPTHGLAVDVMSKVREHSADAIDVTCPFVANVHRIAEDLVSEGYQVVVVGDAGHTEVRGIISRAGECAVVVSDVSELEGVSLQKRVGVLAQTTQSVENFGRVVAGIAARAGETRAFNTICHATMERQQSALELARDVDVMVVVGGRNSANTRRLASICSDAGVPTHHVEISDELLPEWFTDAERVGVTAGASTPDWIIEEVVARLGILKAGR